MLQLCKQGVLQTTTTHSRALKMVKTQLRKSGQFWAQITEKKGAAAHGVKVFHA
jgi:hypothetical protein